jgi:hypothetical protein
LDRVGEPLDDVEASSLGHVRDGFDEAIAEWSGRCGHRGHRATSLRGRGSGDDAVDHVD